MNLAIEILFVAMLAVGAFFSLVGSIGLLRLSDFLRRLHGPTKATTLGVGGVLIASILHHGYISDVFSLRELLITLFLFMTAPISAHMLAKAALALDPALRQASPSDSVPKDSD
jgi:multicomponent K+:H+ antiporter subunit G